MSSSSIHADPPPPIVTEPSGVNYATGPALGKGGFAICHRAERYDGSRPTGQIVALKIVKTKMEPAKLAQKFVTELQIHSKLSHPNIVTFYRAFAFQTSTYVVLELCSNGSLADMLKKRRHLTLPEIRRLVIQVCGAVKYLHNRHIVHRDLKTGNLFLDVNMNVKVGDFGLAALLVTEREMEVRRRTTMCGTPNYLAPEILEKGKGHDEKVDLWAIGVIAYTLAVGKAPFHASTKEEIYKKLRSGTYSWPELNATSDQSSGLRDLVSGLLVPESERLVPDAIASHNFFKMAFVPSSIPASARTVAPTWPEVTLPSANDIRRGYTSGWYELCRESGVGEYTAGQCFQLYNGGRRVRSVVHDIAAEEKEGNTPTMPIPKDKVYMSPINDLDSSDGGVSLPSNDDMNKSTNRGLKELSHNEVASTRPRQAATERASKDADLMPPPKASVRGTGRTGSVRRAARTISEEAAKSAESVKVAMDPSASTTIRVNRTRPTASSSSSAPVARTITSALKELNQSSSTTYQTAATLRVPEEKSSRAATTTRSADASLARRPRGTRSVQGREPTPEQTVHAKAARTVRSCPSPTRDDKPDPLSTLDELRDALPFKYRKKASPIEVIEIHSDSEEAQPSAPSSSSVPTASLHLSKAPQMTSRLPQPQRRDDLSPSIPHTDPTTVLDKLSTFRDNLTAALSSSSSTSPYSPSHAEELPFVSRWVDYSRKHGIGYVLSNGTVGCIINASASRSDATKTHPVTHVLARNGQYWLNRISRDKKFTNLDAVPLQFFEDHGAAGLQRKVFKGLGSVKEGPLADEAERRRILAVLWVKFGRYMCQSLEGSTSETDTQAEEDVPPPSSHGADANKEEVFVRFYQRLGGVGVWVFADGCVQVHFPDHTKFVLSSSARSVSATLLSIEGAAQAAKGKELLPVHVNSRMVVQDFVGELLATSGPGRVRQRLVRVNRVREKLDFVGSVVEQWGRNGGLGIMDEDVGSGERLEWDGGVVAGGEAKGKVERVERVTVGRFGGDK
ncbi:serine/threonine protein kinase [Zymoseptoria brevis]|uniref:Serine/threonine-protein kinase n=1 Tax=Zymoseptoria brevis TaxID=1047168 RepID=A0A0F4GYF9_9PEZI|nr:serine/threonine protein kinase [Zymoseptoria brevis]